MQHVNMGNVGREDSQLPLVRIGDGDSDHWRPILSRSKADASTRCRQMNATPGLADGTD